MSSPTPEDPPMSTEEATGETPLTLKQAECDGLHARCANLEAKIDAAERAFTMIAARRFFAKGRNGGPHRTTISIAENALKDLAEKVDPT